MKTKELVEVSILIALGIVLSIVESFIPMSVPGVKLGLANVVTLVALYRYGIKEASIIQIFRIFIVGLIYSGILSISFLLSLSGGISSLLIMIILKKFSKFNILVISIFGSCFHAVGQILISYLIISSTSVFYYLLLTIALSILCGIITAVIAHLVLKAFKINTIIICKKEIVYISLTFMVFLSTFIVLSNIKKKSDEGSISKIYYNNNLVLSIELDNPLNYKAYSNDFISFNQEEDNYYYTFNVYNTDEKDYFTLILLVNNGGIKIYEETCNKHICSNQGFIYNKYERIVCLPNRFVVTIDNSKIEDIDIIL